MVVVLSLRGVGGLGQTSLFFWTAIAYRMFSTTFNLIWVLWELVRDANCGLWDSYHLTPGWRTMHLKQEKMDPHAMFPGVTSWLHPLQPSPKVLLLRWVAPQPTQVQLQPSTMVEHRLTPSIALLFDDGSCLTLSLVVAEGAWCSTSSFHHQIWGLRPYHSGGSCLRSAVLQYQNVQNNSRLDSLPKA